ncbi:unnamed protein product [Discosporangium mesarthrocarpum]
MHHNDHREEKGGHGHDHSHNHGHSPENIDLEHKCPEGRDVTNGGMLGGDHGGHGGHELEPHGHHGGGGHRRSMNLWAVLVHAAMDAVASGVVCVQGLVIFAVGDPDRLDWTDYLDPITSIFLSAFIIRWSLPIVMECAHVLMEGTPRSINAKEVRKELLQLPGVASVEHLAVSQLNSEEPLVGATRLKLYTEYSPVSLGQGGKRQGQVLRRAKEVLGRHNIKLTVVELVDMEEEGQEEPRGEHVIGPEQGGGGHDHGHIHRHNSGSACTVVDGESRENEHKEEQVVVLLGEKLELV